MSLDVAKVIQRKLNLSKPPSAVQVRIVCALGGFKGVWSGVFVIGCNFDLLSMRASTLSVFCESRRVCKRFPFFCCGSVRYLSEIQTFFLNALCVCELSCSVVCCFCVIIILQWNRPHSHCLFSFDCLASEQICGCCGCLRCRVCAVIFLFVYEDFLSLVCFSLSLRDCAVLWLLHWDHVWLAGIFIYRVAVRDWPSRFSACLQLLRQVHFSVFLCVCAIILIALLVRHFIGYFHVRVGLYAPWLCSFDVSVSVLSSFCLYRMLCYRSCCFSSFCEMGNFLWFSSTLNAFIVVCVMICAP